MFFKIGSIKNFAVFTGKHLYLFNKVAGLKVCGYCENFLEQLSYRTLPVAASDSPTIVQ